MEVDLTERDEKISELQEELQDEAGRVKTMSEEVRFMAFTSFPERVGGKGEVASVAKAPAKPGFDPKGRHIDGLFAGGQ
jgi:hypothetical protein